MRRIWDRVQAMDLDVDRDYQGKENCTEVLNLTRPDVVREIHEGYFAAGADVVETNTFGGSPLTLAEFGLEARAREINRRAAELAREAAELVAGHQIVLQQTIEAQGALSGDRAAIPKP